MSLAMGSQHRGWPPNRVCSRLRSDRIELRRSVVQDDIDHL